MAPLNHLIIFRFSLDDERLSSCFSMPSHDLVQLLPHQLSIWAKNKLPSQTTQRSSLVVPLRTQEGAVTGENRLALELSISIPTRPSLVLPHNLSGGKNSCGYNKLKATTSTATTLSQIKISLHPIPYLKTLPFSLCETPAHLPLRGFLIDSPQSVHQI